MDIIEAVESIRSFKAEIIQSVDIASALHQIVAVRERKQRALSKHDALMDKIISSHTVSGIYNSSGVQTSKNHAAIAEMIEDAADLGKDIQRDNAFLNDAIELVEDIVDAIADIDTRLVIQHKYIDGWTDTEIEELFSESLPGHAQRLEQKYFRSLR